MYRLTLLILPLAVSTPTIAQDGNYSLGARNAALSHTALTLSDSWAVFNSPGALGAVEESALFATYQNRYAIPGFHVMGGGFVAHHTQFNAGLKYFRFGDDLFSQQTAGLVLANQFQRVSLGLGINMIQTAAEGLQTQRGFAVELGGVAEITRQISFGAHIYNLKHRELYPTTMKAGLSFLPIASLRIHLEVEKQLPLRERLKSGLEYQVIEKLYLRTGMIIQGNAVGQSSLKSSFGFGILPGDFIIDYAFTNDGPLGAIHELSIGHYLRKR